MKKILMLLMVLIMSLTSCEEFFNEIIKCEKEYEKHLTVKVRVMILHDGKPIDYKVNMWYYGQKLYCNGDESDWIRGKVITDFNGYGEGNVIMSFNYYNNFDRVKVVMGFESANISQEKFIEYTVFGGADKKTEVVDFVFNL